MTYLIENIDYCDKQGILWLPVILKIEDNRKIFYDKVSDILGYTPTFDRFPRDGDGEMSRLRKEEIVKRDMDRFLKNKDYILQECESKGLSLVLGMDTNKISQLDIDDERIRHVPYFKELKKRCPYHLSKTKKFEKYLFHKKEMSPKDNQKNNENLYSLMDEPKALLEVQQGQWSYLDITSPIYNKDIPIPTLDQDEIKEAIVKELGESSTTSVSKCPKIKKTKKERKGVCLPAPDKEEFEFCLSILDIEHRFSSYEGWRNIGYIIKLYFDNEYGYGLWKTYSQKAKGYEMSDWSENSSHYTTWYYLKPNGSLTYEVLKNWAKSDSPKPYFRQFPSEVIELKSYQETKRDFEESYIKLTCPFQYVRIAKNTFYLYSHKNIEDMFINKGCLGKVYNPKKDCMEEKEVGFIGRWINDENIKTFDKIDFDPSQPIEYRDENNFKCINVFRELAVESIIRECETECISENVEEEVQMFFDLLFDICGRDEKAFDYVFNWIAHLFQKPAEKTLTSILFNSIQGLGKNTLFEYIGRLLGYFLVTTNIDNLFGDFNESLRCKIFVIVNEVSGKETTKYKEKMKSLITDSYININEKYKNTQHIKNNVNMIMFTNNQCPVMIEDMDRRYVCIKGHHQVKSIDFFERLYSVMDMTTKKGKAFAKEIAEIFFDRDITDFNPRKKIETEYFNTIKQVNTVVRFLDHYFQNKSHICDPIHIQAEKLYTNPLPKNAKDSEEPMSFVKFCKDYNYEQIKGSAFYRQMRDYTKETGGFVSLKRTPKGIYYNITRDDFYKYMLEHKYISQEDFNIITQNPLLI